MRWRKKRERDLDRELRDHLELEAEKQQERGLSPEDARYAARRAFGNPTLIKEEVREMWRWTTLEQIAQDVRYALRGALKSPGFALVAMHRSHGCGSACGVRARAPGESH